MEENNKLIAEFMGMSNVKEDNGRFSGNNCGHEYSAMMGDNEIPMIHTECKPDITELAKYHASWDWLMPVVKKIDEVGFTVDFQVSEPNSICGVSGFGYSNTEKGKFKEATYKAVVAFIKWYNTNKNEKSN